jgi:hypothetical protein
MTERFNILILEHYNGVYHTGGAYGYYYDDDF